MPPGGRSPGRAAALSVSLLLAACSAGRQRAPGQYAQQRDSASNACRHNSALCVPGPGERMAVVPPVRPAGPPVSGWKAAATAAVGGVVIKAQPLEAGLQEQIEEALAECADMARSQVMLQHFRDRGPTREECEEVVGYDNRGEPITRAMKLGVEQHKVALQCAEERLSQSRYRHDPRTGKTEHVPKEMVRDLLEQGRGAELRGTLEPDIILHDGGPHQAQAVYDYKFPCVNTDKRSPWRQYPRGHVHAGKHQGSMYEKAFGMQPAIVQPRVGIIR
jgi:hypothetical protein